MSTQFHNWPFNFFRLKMAFMLEAVMIQSLMKYGNPEYFGIQF
jgi:hypothetical protein